MQPKTFKTLRGAQRFQRQLIAFNPRVFTQINSDVGRDFRTRYFVEAIVDRGEKVYAYACGPLTRENAAKVAHVR